MATLPPQQELLRAFDSRDSTYDGVFFVAVKTTGIFCRPVCTAKKPKLENVEFFATGREAMFAGYRPCLRCKPLTAGQKPPELVSKLLAAINAEPSGRIRDGDLREQGIDPSTARRQFQKQFGMTFQAYHRALRMGSALKQVRGGRRVIDSQIEAGFESGSGFRDAFARLFGTSPKRGGGTACLLARWLDTPLGAMLALADDDGLHVLDFVDRRGLERELERIAKRYAIVPGPHPVLDHTEREMREYFLGTRREFTIPLAHRGTDFQRNVWDQLVQIEPGITRSYADIARRIDLPKGVRAVARANGDNYRAIVVPCHRVIGSDGSLTGYGGGLARKQWLLDHEASMEAPSRKAA
jgi:AraC family transcriptional regulator, regulatory protein of adaptative response / methylated-DNA-[protein]-cysteine methyltransferase